MKTRPVGAELFHADGRTGEANSRFFAILRTRLKMFKNMQSIHGFRQSRPCTGDQSLSHLTCAA